LCLRFILVFGYMFVWAVHADTGDRVQIVAIV